jgi:hypothetical protein
MATPTTSQKEPAKDSKMAEKKVQVSGWKQAKLKAEPRENA